MSETSSERAALEELVASHAFAKSPRLASLLQYLCEKHFRSEGSSLKEYNIAIDVFGRPPNFDQAADAIVRVEMHRLRKKLERYYAGEGKDARFRILVQPGCYSPLFVESPAVKRPGEVTEQSEETGTPNASRVTSPAAPAKGFPFAVAALLLGFLGVVTFAVQLWFGHAVRARELRPAVPPLAVAGPGVRLLCGSTQPFERDRNGNRWEPDKYFSGGSAVEAPPQPLYRTRDFRLFATSRRGEFRYRIPLRPGVYEMRLYFADTSYHPGFSMEGGEGRRFFQVTLNGKPLLTNFDIIADSGPDTADIRVFKDVSPAPDGFLELRFIPTLGEPLLNAIDILPGVPHHTRPLRIVTQDQPYTDSTGAVWSPDSYFRYGRQISKSGAIGGTRDPELYSWERYGNFSYAIPVPPGRYAVTLHFAETYFGPQDPGGGGAGTRVFDVLCNGVTLLKNFDLLREGPVRTGIARTFHGLQPNGQGKLRLSFIPSVNYATVSAIEVVDESN